MGVNCIIPAGTDFGELQNVQPAVVDKLLILGFWVDRELMLQDHLDQVCGRLWDGTRDLVRKMNDLGFGLPFQVFQFGLRVRASAFHGVEVLASYGLGWKSAPRRLNDTMDLQSLCWGCRQVCHWDPGLR